MARFPIRLTGRYRIPLLLFGVTTRNAEVGLEAGELHARFGFFALRTPISNIVRWRIEGPFFWLGAIGVRRGIRDHDVTFGGSTHGGVRIEFRQSVPWSMFRAPAMYVTVDDLEGLAAELTRLGIPGEDARKRIVP